jgi:hypothetical protein
MRLSATMLGLVPLGNEPPYERGRKLCVDEKPHQVTCNTGWLLWRAAYSSAAVMSSASGNG